MAIDLATISGCPQPGDKFSADIQHPIKDDYVSCISVEGEVLLYVGFGEPGHAIISRQTAGEWQVHDEFSIPTDDIALRIEFEDATCSVILAGHQVQVPVDRPRVWRLIGQGAWRNSILQLFGVDEADKAVLHQLPQRAAAHQERQKDLIFDVGMHRGSDTAFYLAKGFRVVAFEANPNLCKAGARRFATEIAAGMLQIVNVGIGPKRGHLPFFVNEENSEWSSFDRLIAERGRCSEITVPVHPMADIMAVFGVPHYIKADIEGYDRYAIIPLAESPDKPACLSYENADRDVFEILVANGYRAFQLVNQLHVQSVQCPRPSAEGKTIEWSFEPGSSGPFGSDLPAAWLDAAAMQRRLEQYGAEHLATLAAGELDWFDLHARLDEV